MLVNGRQEMVNRAVASFDAQVYPNTYMLVLDSGQPQTCIIRELRNVRQGCNDMRVHYLGGPLHKHTIGSLRNLANGLCADADIIAHWDSDDWSNPLRLEEQVALLQASGAACVGYREALFWDTRVSPGEAWLYSDPNPRGLIGASMCYWRSAWEACPFDDAPHEDRRWWLKNAKRCLGIFSVGDFYAMMICGIHGGNTEPYDRAEMARFHEWQRAPDWDKCCAGVMKL